MTIALLCPTRARPNQYARMVQSAKATAHNADNLAFYTALSAEDMAAYAPMTATSIIMRDGTPTVYKWNCLAHEAKKDERTKLFMLAADDTIFTTPHWDKALLDHYNDLVNKIHVYALRDSRDEDGTPHPIVTREYIDAMGYFLPPIFMHWFCDTWTVEIAKCNGCFTHMKDYELVHDKPSDRGLADSTHLNIRMDCWLNNDKAVDKTCHHFLALEQSRLKMRMAR